MSIDDFRNSRIGYAVCFDVGFKVVQHWCDMLCDAVFAIVDDLHREDAMCGERKCNA